MTRVDELERLGRLREQGVLTNEEFQREKSKLLGEDKHAAAIAGSRPKSDPWAPRFAFFDEYGSPFSRKATEGLRHMGVMERTRIVFNIWGCCSARSTSCTWEFRREQLASQE